MAVFGWVGGSVLPGAGRYATASDWYDLTTGALGAAAPEAGDTVDIAGVGNPGISKLGALWTFPLNGGFTQVLLEPAVPGLTLLDAPNSIVGYTIQGQTLNLDGTQGVANLWLENSHLVNDTINAAGTTVINSYLDSTVSGTITIGTAAGPGDLQDEVIPTDTAGVGPSDHNPVITYNANVTVSQGSEFDVQAGTAGTVAGFINNGTITAAPGGTVVFDDTDNPDTASDTAPVTDTSSHSMVLGNGGAIDVLGAAGQTTRAVLLVDTIGPGTIGINGNGAAPGATTLTVDGYLQNQNVLLTDGTVTINDTTFALADPGTAGFDVTGGSFTFGDGNGVLVLHQAALTTLAFNATDTGEVQTPDGHTPFSTPIYGFGQGDVIKLPGKDLAGFGFASYDTVYNPVTGVLQVQSPASLAGNPPEVLASLTFVGSYNPALFQLTGNNATEELDLTYNGPPAPLFDITDTATGASSGSAGTAYTGPVSLLQHQFIWSSPDGAAIAAAVPDVFLHGGAGNDALSVGGGTNVLDGGLGSNFLVGGTGADGGADTFFLDGRAAGSTWSTVANFHHGDAVTIFGFVAGVSTQPWTAVDGAAGYQGATIHSELAGAGTGVNASVTFAGVSLADALGKFSVTTGVVGGTPYLNVAYTG